MTDEERLQKEMAGFLGLRDSESETLMALFKRCSGYGAAVGAATAVATANAGAVALPVVGSVPGWFAGFLTGYSVITLSCVAINRAIVIEALKSFLSADRGREVSDEEAIVALRMELARMGPRMSRA